VQRRALNCPACVQQPQQNLALLVDRTRGTMSRERSGKGREEVAAQG